MLKGIPENQQIKEDIFKIPDEIFWKKIKLEKKLYKSNRNKGKNK